MIRLCANESSLGASPKALAAYHAAAAHLGRYPDKDQGALRQAIAGQFGLDAAGVVCGNGSDELIGLAARAFLKAGDQALLSENSFVMAEFHCRAQGAEVAAAAEVDWRVNVSNLLAAVTGKTRLCTIANPNNPTGTYIDGREMRRLLSGLPQDCVLLVDEAYAEYATADDFQSALASVDEFPNLIVTRTFSKAYGLAALRAGWCFGAAPLIHRLQRVRAPFNTNAAGLAAAAAAVQDQAFIHRVRLANAEQRERMAAALPGLGLAVVPSQSNFHLIRFPEARGKTGAAAARFLRRRGILPGPVGPTDACLRITVGSADENEAVLAALKEYMSST